MFLCFKEGKLTCKPALTDLLFGTFLDLPAPTFPPLPPFPPLPAAYKTHI
jgi:hypothetical protein